MARVVLVTGVSRHLGGRLAAALQAEASLDRVIGVDTAPPSVEFTRAEFVRADIRAPTIAKVISSVGADTVVHAGLPAGSGDAGVHAPMGEAIILGTMQLLAACQRAAGLRKLVVCSTSAVYGSSPRDPALFTEDMEPVSLPRSGYARDAWEVEGYVRGFARRRPDVVVSTLRFVDLMGPQVDSPLTRYFTLPVWPTVLGFDPRLQFVHADDGLEALRRMTLEDHPGTYNVSGAGVMMLSQAARRAGRPMVAVPALAIRVGGELARCAGLVDVSPEQVGLLAYGRAVDASRLRAELRWAPAYTTVEAFDDFVRGRGLDRIVPLEPLDRLRLDLLGSV